MQVIRDTLQPKEKAEQNGVLVLGNFDGIHVGHRLLLQEAAALAGRKALARRVLTFSPHPRQVMGQTDFRLIYSEEQKIAIMKETGLVDELIFLSFEHELRYMEPVTFFEKILCQRYSAKAVVVGENFHFGYQGQGDSRLLQMLCEQRELQCRVLSRKESEGQPISSSRIRALLEAGNMEEAGQLLGRPYFIEGRVSRGKQLGRQMQTPTINLLMNEERLTPKKGVYISRTITESGVYPSISNVGHNPTVGGESLRTETHLLAFSGNLYEQNVRVELLRYLRPERKFESIQALQMQLLQDIQTAKAYF